MKKHRRNLSLRSETILALGVGALTRVIGGQDVTRDCPHTFDCMTNQSCRFCPSFVQELTCRCVTL